MTTSLISVHVHDNAWWDDQRKKGTHFHLQLPYLFAAVINGEVDIDPAPSCVEINCDDARKLERRGSHKIIGSTDDKVVTPVIVAQRGIVFQLGESPL